MIRILELTLTRHSHSTCLLLSQELSVRKRLSGTQLAWLSLRCAHVRLLSKQRILSTYLGIMLVHKLLNHLQRLFFQISGLLRHYLLDLSQEVSPHVFVSVVLKHITRQLHACEALSVDEMAKVSTGASNRAMVIPTRHSAVVTWLDELVGIERFVGF